MSFVLYLLQRLSKGKLSVPNYCPLETENNAFETFFK